jgi:hypothetical protein
MPAMQRLYLAHRDHGLVVVGVNFKESTRQVQDFNAEAGPDLERRILWRAIGEREWDTSATRAYLDQLLAS